MPTVVLVILAVGAMVLMIQMGEALTRRAGRARRAVDDRELYALREQVDTLRREITTLREIVGEHAMSVDRNLDTLNERLQKLESRETSPEIRQVLGGGPE